MLTDLDDFYCFAQVVEHGGFSAAERATDIPKSKLSRRVHNLEERLGVRLIQRSSRHFAVTDIGMNVYRHAQVMLNAAQAAHDLVDHLSTEPRGTIKVSLPVLIAQNEIAKILPNFLKQYPEIKVQMMITNRRVDIINEGFDLALRVRSSLDDDPNLVIRQFEKIEQHLAGVCTAYDATYDYNYVEGYPPVVNHDEQTEVVAQAAEKSLANLNVEQCKPMMIGEDFAYYLQHVPGSFFFVGAKDSNADIQYPHHHARFNFDEKAMLHTASIFSEILAERL